MKHLKKFYEDFEIRGDSLSHNQVEDWEFIKEIFLELSVTYWKIIKSNVSTQERYQLNLSEKNLERFSLSRPGKTLHGSFEPFKLRDIEYELLHLLNYLGDRFVCMSINYVIPYRYSSDSEFNLRQGDTRSTKFTDVLSVDNLDFFDGKFPNIYYLSFYYKSDF
jgi:hypothetical protein